MSTVTKRGVTTADLAHLQAGDEVTIVREWKGALVTTTGPLRATALGLAVGNLVVGVPDVDTNHQLIDGEWEITYPAPPSPPVGQRRRSPNGVEVIRSDDGGSAPWIAYRGRKGPDWYSDSAVTDWEVITDTPPLTLAEIEAIVLGAIPTAWLMDETSLPLVSQAIAREIAARLAP